MMWLRHWGLQFDPFLPGAVPFVATAGHEEAVARFVHLVENGERRGDLRGQAGIGKSAIIDEAARRLRRRDRRIVVVRHPVDGAALLRGLADGLGLKIGAATSRSEAMGRLLDAMRVARAQGLGVVLAIDDDGMLDAPEDRRVVDRVEAIGKQSGCRVSTLVTGREVAIGGEGEPLRVRLDRLTRGEAESYLVAKLRAAGREGETFSERAILRLHAESGGLPGAIDRLAGLAMRAGALERRDRVPSGLVAGVARECVAPS